jgi:hypothetical protein
MIVAIFGDVHGNLAGMYELCADWQRLQKQNMDLVLQTGDMGLWRSFDEMDKATKKHFAKDVGWGLPHHHFVGGLMPALPAAPYLSGEQIAPIETWFVHGNHENFAVLADKEGQAVDAAGRIIFLAPGSIREFRKEKESLRVAALGGMEYRFGKFPIPSEQRIAKYLHPPSLDRLRQEKAQIDILLLHDAPLNKGLRDKFPTGSKRLTELILDIQPRFVFYGHYDDPPEPFQIGSTLCAGMNLASARRIANRDGAMGILRTDTWEFSFVEPV